MDGYEEVGTSIGCLCSVFLFLTVLAYGLPKFFSMYNRTSPMIRQFNDKNARNITESYTIEDLGFFFAFTVTDPDKFEPLNDPEYVNWLVLLQEKDDHGHYK